MTLSNNAQATITNLENTLELIREFEFEVRELENTVAYCQLMGTEPSMQVKINLAEAKELLACSTSKWNELLESSTL